MAGGRSRTASYLSDADERIADLRVAVATGDAAHALRIAHALRAASASLGARRLARLLGELERAAGSRELRADLERLGDAVLAEYDRVAVEIRDRLAAEVVPAPGPRS